MQIRPFDAIMLDAGDGHWLYVEQVGTQGAIPAVFLHGGPGSGAQHSHRNIFDPDRFHTFLFDQRGAGRSHPNLSLTDNTTQNLIADIERIRTFFKVERWIVVGGSWGSTLALAYAQAHPQRVIGLVLRAIFLGSDEEVQWAFDNGPKRFRPELHRAFCDALPEAERSTLIESYTKRLVDPNPDIHRPAAELWHSYERALSELKPAEQSLPITPAAPGTRTKPTAIMEAHYIRNHFFLEPNQLLDGMSKIAEIPGHIIQGRYDLLCPPQAAYRIAERWPAAKVTFIEQAGHAMTEPGVSDAMRDALLNFADTAKTST